MVNNCSSNKSDPCWFLDKLFEAEKLIQTRNVSGIVIRCLINWFLGKITICVSDENDFFAFLVKESKGFFQLIKGINWITWLSVPSNNKKGFAFECGYLNTEKF